MIALVLVLRDDPMPSTQQNAPKSDKAARTVSIEERADAIARATVWREPAVAVSRAILGPPTAPHIDCRFALSDLGGTTPKFHCLLDGGDEIRAKYGIGSEIPAEAAATRLLSALGFGADNVMLVERLRCHGCPKEPFVTSKVVEATGTEGVYERVVDPDGYEEFEWAAVESRFDAASIEAEEKKGWAFFELDTVDPAKGGAPRAHVDALRLIAVFLAHWDNKADNQRLVCLSEDWPDGRPCREPFLLLQDVGATFGPKKVDLAAWEKAALWEDRATCTVTMKEMPYNGGTFRSTRISESGRRLLVGLLAQLTDQQLVDLFSGARFDQPRRPLMQTAPVPDWVHAFKGRVAAISEGPPCPDA